jgi:hypothetical protein
LPCEWSPGASCVQHLRVTDSRSESAAHSVMIHWHSSQRSRPGPASQACRPRRALHSGPAAAGYAGQWCPTALGLFATAATFLTLQANMLRGPSPSPASPAPPPHAPDSAGATATECNAAAYVEAPGSGPARACSSGRREPARFLAIPAARTPSGTSANAQSESPAAPAATGLPPERAISPSSGAASAAQHAESTAVPATQ